MNGVNFAKRMGTTLILGLCCLAVVACKEEQHPQLPRTAGGELVYMVADSLLTEEERELKAEYIHLVPDYLLTEEEEELLCSFLTRIDDNFRRQP